MSKPVNSKEHNNAFTKFIIFFLVTLAMAVGAIYYNFKIHDKELSILRVRSELLRNQQISQEKYKRVLNEVVDLLDKTDSGKALVIGSELTVKMDELKNIAAIEDSSASKKLHQSVLYLVQRYKDAKFRLSDLSGYEKELLNKDREITTLKQERSDLYDKIRLLNAGN